MRDFIEQLKDMDIEQIQFALKEIKKHKFLMQDETIFLTRLYNLKLLQLKNQRKGA